MAAQREFRPATWPTRLPLHLAGRPAVALFNSILFFCSRSPRFQFTPDNRLTVDIMYPQLHLLYTLRALLVFVRLLFFEAGSEMASLVSYLCSLSLCPQKPMVHSYEWWLKCRAQITPIIAWLAPHLYWTQARQITLSLLQGRHWLPEAAHCASAVHCKWGQAFTVLHDEDQGGLRVH
jgi:hypothetical protein